MAELFGSATATGSVRVWSVGALCRAVGDALDARFNPVVVSGELSGFSRAASGHCYFSLKDESGQMRCAMFRRAASLLDFSPKDGEQVEVRGRLGVYEARGDLQLVAESMTRAGRGTLFEQFLQLKSRLEAQGLFAPERKRALSAMPRAIGVVTSLGAAALHDVVTALQRRAPYLPVVVAPAAVQGSNAPAELIKALSNLYLLAQEQQGPEAVLVNNSLSRPARPPIDVILLVRGGGSLEDLWAFNDEQLARTIAQSPVPLICGVGHETDFTIADFVADLRAPTPTAAAELAAPSRDALLQGVDAIRKRLSDTLLRRLDRHAQWLDGASARLARPSTLVLRLRLRQDAQAQRLQYAARQFLQRKGRELAQTQAQVPRHAARGLAQRQQRLERAALRLDLLDPTLVLRRGYAWLTGPDGHTVSRVAQTHPGDRLRATLADGAVDLGVLPAP